MAPNADLRPFQIVALSSGLCADARGDRIVRLGDLDDPREQRVDLVLRSFDLDDQQRLDVHRVSGLGERLADLDRRLVHEFDGDRDDAAAMIADTQAPAASLEAKPSSIGRAPSAARRMRTVASVTMPNWPSEPMHRPSRS